MTVSDREAQATTAASFSAADDEYVPDPPRWRALAVVPVAGLMVLLT